MVSDLYGNGRAKLAQGASLSNVRWSHDGSKIAYEKESAIWVVNADGTGERSLSPKLSTLFAPVWSADDTRIYYGHCVTVANGTDCYPSASEYPSAFADFSPDGTRVAWTMGDGGPSSGLAVMSLDGSGRMQITDPGLEADSAPRWSPDSQRLLFTRGTTEKVDAYVVGADGSGLTLVRENAFSSAWSPDGTRVMVQDSPSGLVQIVPLGGGTTTRVGGCDRVFFGADWRPVPPTRAGQAASWGWNGFGQLGDGGTVDRATPGPVAGLTGVVGQASGLFHSVALKDDGTLWAWGWNGFGQLGDGTTVDRATPVRVASLTNVVCVAASAYDSVAIRSDGTVWSWGWNGSGALGDGTTVDRHVPVQAVGLTDVTSVGAGVLHTVASRLDGTAWAWGWNGFGQLGDGTTVSHTAPARVTGFLALDGPHERIRAVAAGAYHSLAMAWDGDVYAWGWNGLGQLGDSSTVDRLSPSWPVETGNAQSIASGAYHGVELRRDGTVMTWGWNGVGQLGDGTTVDNHTAVVIPAFGSVTEIAAGWFNTFALTSDHTAFGWGWNHLGELGDGTTTDRDAPTPLPALEGVGAIGPGPLHGLAA